MNTSFSTRVATYFGALFLAAMGLMFVLWYQGLPQIGVVGARNQRLIEAMRNLETRADYQRAFIAEAIKERRGDILVAAESKVLTRLLEANGTSAQPDIERIFNRLQRAYPDRYQRLMIVSPVSGQIQASSVADERGQMFQDPALIKRAAQLGITELIEQLPGKHGPAVAIVRQVHALGADGNPGEHLVGILIAYIEPQQLLADELRDELPLSRKTGHVMLLDSTGQLIATSAGSTADSASLTLKHPPSAGFEGTLLDVDDSNREQVMVYRHLPLSGMQAWTLVHYLSKDEALKGLAGSAARLAGVGLLLTLAALMLISLVARRLTRPLQLLAATAGQLGAGNLSARVADVRDQSLEVAVLSTAFNAMAESIENAHQTLEARVSERTADLQRSETRHRTLFESTADAVLILNREGFIDCNPAAVAIFGASCREDILGKHPAELSPATQANGENSRIAAERLIDQALSEGSVTFEWIHSRRDSGNNFFARVLLSRMMIDGQTLIQVNIRDISERNAAMAQLSKLSLAVEQSPESIVITDVATRIEYVNEAFLLATGYNREEVIGKNPRILHSGKTPSETYIAMWDALSRGQPWRGELYNRRKDGSEYIEFAIITPLRRPDGRITHFVAVKDDITAKKRLSMELDGHRHHLESLVAQRTVELTAARQQAEAANRAKSVFLSNMSHELRTPLNAILGFAQLLKRDSGLGEEGRKKLATINSAGQHLLMLINDVLEISRIEAGRSVIQREAFDLQSSLTSIEEMIRVRADGKGLAFHVEHAADLPQVVEGDVARLKQVLINLLGNAVKYTERGSIGLRVEHHHNGANGSAHADEIRFEVADTGPGIATADQERIFQAFFQTEVGIAKGDGTGLGLAISREYTRLMGGRLEVQSQPGQGSTFILTLPLPPAQAPAMAPDTGSVIGLEGGQEGVRVLVVDDKADNRELVLQLLQTAGFEVRTADNGEEAVAAFLSWRPRLIWMDMRMPVMDGYTATRQIRALPGGDQVKIVALTATAFEEDREEILAAGCDDLVRKPVDEDRLFTIMGQQLGLRYRRAGTAPAPAPAEIDLARLPPELLKQLETAAAALDLAAARQIVAQIRPAQPELAAALEALVREFRFDRIADLCQQARAGHPARNSGMQTGEGS